jgi:hypothetical protein
MLKGVKKRQRRRRGPRVMVVRRRMKPMSNPLNLLVAMGRGQQKRKSATSLTPKRATKPPMSTKAVLLLVSLQNTSKE